MELTISLSMVNHPPEISQNLPSGLRCWSKEFPRVCSIILQKLLKIYLWSQVLEQRVSLSMVHHSPEASQNLPLVADFGSKSFLENGPSSSRKYPKIYLLFMMMERRVSYLKFYLFFRCWSKEFHSSKSTSCFRCQSK